MKKNKKGFFLSELIIVTSVVLLASITLYTQTTAIMKNNENKARYNSVDGIYRAKNVKDYLFRFEKITDFTTAAGEIQDISSSLSNQYITTLKNNLNIEKVLFIKKGTASNTVKTYNTNIDKDFKRFLNWVSINKMGNQTTGRLIVNYKDKGKDFYSIIEVQYE